MAVFCLSCPVYEECWHDNPGELDETERVGGGDAEVGNTTG